jgi:putative Mn2+ efflux pump MntP
LIHALSISNNFLFVFIFFIFEFLLLLFGWLSLQIFSTGTESSYVTVMGHLSAGIVRMRLVGAYSAFPLFPDTLDTFGMNILDIEDLLFHLIT